LSFSASFDSPISFTQTFTGSESIPTITIEPSSTSSEANPVVTNLVQQKSHRAAIVGGVVGGLVALVIILFVVFMLLRRIRKSGRDIGKKMGQAEQDPKSYLDLDRQSPGFFPKEYTGPWTETIKQPRSSSHLI
jgi:hypothetical protein